MLLRDEQSWNAPSPIAVKELGSLMFFNAEQP